jgi:hypothetical protein
LHRKSGDFRRNCYWLDGKIVVFLQRRLAGPQSLLIEGQRQRGVRRVYGVPGDYLLGLLTGCPAASAP